MKTDIYGLLGMIKDDKAPKKILFKGDIYEYRCSECSECIDYYCDNDGSWLFDDYDITSILNDEVTILETTITYKHDVNNCKQDDISKLPYYDYSWRNQTMELSFEDRKRLDYAEKRLDDYHNKINEIIDYLNK